MFAHIVQEEAKEEKLRAKFKVSYVCYLLQYVYFRTFMEHRIFPPNPIFFCKIKLFLVQFLHSKVALSVIFITWDC